MNNTKKYLSLSELAAEAGVVTQTVRNYVYSEKIIPDIMVGKHPYFDADKLFFYIDILTGGENSALILRFNADNTQNVITDDELQSYIKTKGYAFNSETAYDERELFVQHELTTYRSSKEYTASIIELVNKKKNERREELLSKLEALKEEKVKGLSSDVNIVRGNFLLGVIEKDTDISELRDAFDIDNTISDAEARQMLKERVTKSMEVIIAEYSKSYNYQITYFQRDLESLDDYFSDGSSSLMKVGEGYQKIVEQIESSFKESLLSANSGVKKLKRYTIIDVTNTDTLKEILFGVFSKKYRVVVIAGDIDSTMRCVFDTVDKANLAYVYYYEGM